MAENKIKIFEKDQKVKAVTMLPCGVVRYDDPQGWATGKDSCQQLGTFGLCWGGCEAQLCTDKGRNRLAPSFFKDEDELKSQGKKMLPKEEKG